MRKGLILFVIAGVIGAVYGVLEIFRRYPLEEVFSFTFIIVSVALLSMFALAVITVQAQGGGH